MCPMLIKFVSRMSAPRCVYGTCIPMYLLPCLWKEDGAQSRAIGGGYNPFIFSNKSVLLGNKAVLQLRCMNVTEKFDLTNRFQILPNIIQDIYEQWRQTDLTGWGTCPKRQRWRKVMIQCRNVWTRGHIAVLQNNIWASAVLGCLYRKC